MAWLGWERMAEVTSWDFWGQGLNKDFEIVFEVKNFNNLFPFLDHGQGQGCLLLDNVLQGQCYLWYAFRDRINGESSFWDKTDGEKAQSDNTDSI